jgi:hypothetical protein
MNFVALVHNAPGRAKLHHDPFVRPFFNQKE